MTDYFVASGGSNTSPYDTWAKAATSLATALAAASTNGDRVIIQYDGVPDGDEELAADTVYAAAASIEIISSTNSGTSTITPTAMGASNWIGNSTTFRSVTLNCAVGETLYAYGLTLRTAGSTVKSIIIGSAVGSVVLDTCYLWQGNDVSTGGILVGPTSGANETYVTMKNCTWRFADTGQALTHRGCGMTCENCTVSSSGSAIIAAIKGASVSNAVLLDGCDFSHVNTSLVADQTSGHKTITFKNCKLPASYVALDSQTAPGKAGADVWLFDCHSGDEHIHVGHYNGLGSTVIDTGIYATDNVADTNLSWKIVGTSTATPEVPYESPWIEVYHTGTSAITPYLECVRSGSATAYDNDEVWSQWAYKGTASSTKVTFVGDGVALAGSAAAQTDSSKSASDWTGENATSWFGKLAPASSFTPAEAGHIRARVCVAGANTVYVDPQIRGLS